MKFKRLATFLCGAAMFTSTMLTMSVCSATIEGTQIMIDRLYPGMDSYTMIDYFGHPKEKDGNKWIYKHFHAVVENGMVIRISTHSDRYATPDTIRCGLSEYALEQVYGRADKVHKNKKGEVTYTYYSRHDATMFEFRVVDGLIEKITCEFND